MLQGHSKFYLLDLATPQWNVYVYSPNPWHSRRNSHKRTPKGKPKKKANICPHYLGWEFACNAESHCLAMNWYAMDSSLSSYIQSQINCTYMHSAFDCNALYKSLRLSFI